MMSIDRGKPVIPIHLDLSAAVDTVDHNVLFSSLKDMFGQSGKVLEWFISWQWIKIFLFLEEFRTLYC